MQRKSRSEYPANWKQLAEAVKDAANWHCVRCGHPHDPNIPALCQRCHLQIQAKVILERQWMFEHSEWFKPYVAGYYAALHGLPTSREYVMANLEMLLR